ncbi:MAG: endolytic transglycosylase MltG [Bacteroidota bacterium]
MMYPTFREFFAAILLCLAVTLLVFTSRYNRLYGDSAVTAEQPIVLIIEQTSGVDELIAEFESKSIRFDPDILRWAARVHGWRTYRPGRYELGEAISYNELLSKLARGIQDPGNVVIHSGIEPGILSQRLAFQLQADSAAFAEQFTDSSTIAFELNLTGEQLFSRMLPNTYQMYWTSSPEQVVRRVYREFEQEIINDYSEEIEQSRYSLNEIVTLASIVEWEARDAAEKERISGLYQNRLNRGMMLQADPTVLYALGERRRLLYQDYTYDHPYNTYLYRGLPPGPITNPDKMSIRAVLQPEEHDYLFMVATPEGSHEFNETFEKHRESSQNWRRWIQEQYRIKRELEQQEASEVENQ